MSLFDQMKTQAQKALELKNSKEKLNSEEFAQRNFKLRQIFDYWHEFSELTKVIQPDFVPLVALPGIGEMSGLRLVDTFSDYRHASIGNQNFTDQIDSVSLYFFYKSPQYFKFTKEIGYAEIVKEALWRYGITHSTEDIKNEQARVVKVVFNIPWEVRGSVTVMPILNSKVLKFVLKNVAKLGDVTLEVTYDQVDIVFLDHLSKLLLGDGNRFWKLVKL
jgi:hypothetical protein